MRNLARGRHAERTPFEMQRIKLIEELVADKINPLEITISSSGGETKLTHDDVANYIEHTNRSFNVVASAVRLEGEGKNVKHTPHTN